MSPCLLWCIRREINYRNFEVREKKLEELESFFSSILFIFGQLHLFLLWFSVIMISLFFFFFLPSSYLGVLYYILLMYLRRFMLFMIFWLHIKKNKSV